MTQYPWKHYDNPVYWTLPNDGAKFKCDDCKEYFTYKQVILTQIPKDDSRSVLCKECIDDDWMRRAVNMGEFDSG